MHVYRIQWSRIINVFKKCIIIECSTVFKFYKIDNFVLFNYSTLVHSCEINTHYMKNKLSIKGN